MKRVMLFIFLATTIAAAGCTAQLGPSESDVEGSGVSTGTGGDGSGPTGTGGDAPAEVPN